MSDVRGFVAVVTLDQFLNTIIEAFYRKKIRYMLSFVSLLQ